MTKNKKAVGAEVTTMGNLAPKQMVNSIDMAQSLDDKKRFAEQMIRSGLLPATLATPDHLDDEDLRDQAIGGVIAVVEYGRELNISPWVALHGMHIVAGKVVVGVHIYLGLASRAGIIVNVEKDYEKQYKTVDGKEKLVDKVTTVSFTQYIETPMGPKEVVRKHTKRWTEIIKAKLHERDNYDKRPATMLRTRCIVEGLRLYAADLYMGAMERTEMLDHNHTEYTVDIEGEVLETGSDN
jgi:hypothetical protein